MKLRPCANNCVSLQVDTIGAVHIEVVDSVEDYVQLMKKIFDFNLLKNFLSNFSIVINSMHGGKNKLHFIP